MGSSLKEPIFSTIISQNIIRKKEVLVLRMGHGGEGVQSMFSRERQNCCDYLNWEVSGIFL